VTGGLAGLHDAASGLVFDSMSALFRRPFDSSWTLLLVLGIVVSLVVFMVVLFCFICWKCRRRNEKLLNDEMMIKDKEQEKLLFLNGGVVGHHHHHHHQANVHLSSIDHLDHHNPHYNQNYLQNDSSTTLLSNNKLTNSIRMAYPNPNSNLTANGGATMHHPVNDIYANHSLLTTTSTTTGSYLANATNTQHIAIDTSNHTPRYHLLQQQQQQHQSLNHGQQQDSCYYDDLRYNNNNNNNTTTSDDQILNNHHHHHQQQQQQNLYSSPYRQQFQLQSSYSPIIRRDIDPTIPLYATLKPKLMMQQQQHQRQYSSNYAQFSTLHRNSGSQCQTPPLPMPRRTGPCLASPLPPPPPPPPPPPAVQAPQKPARTFEYINDLRSESGAFLLSAEDSSTPPEYEQGSTTSLDEEDLDLNDLKDFEDVTFDNLRKPGERPTATTTTTTQRKQMSVSSSSTAENIANNSTKRRRQQASSAATLHKQKMQSLAFKNEIDAAAVNTNSEQSLLLKSSQSSVTAAAATNEVSILAQDNNGIINSNLKKLESNNKFVSVINETNLELESKDANNSKIYEETEI
jgi:hypothetical protein